MKSCVACAEDIKPQALLCRWCGTRQDNPDYASPPSVPHPEKVTSDSGPEPNGIESTLAWDKQVLNGRQNLMHAAESRDYSSTEDFETPSSKVPYYRRPSSSRGEAAEVSQTFPILRVLAIVVACVLFVSGLAYTYNPDYRYQFDALFTNLFSSEGSYYKKGFEDARKLGASQNQTAGFAVTYCSIIANASGLEEAVARNEYFKGCVDFVQKP